MKKILELIATLVACMCCPVEAAKAVNEAETPKDVSAGRIWGK